MNFVTVQNHRLEYRLIHAAPSDAPVIVFLHEGLGSAEMWKDFPERMAHASACNALIYSRYGYGRSDPLTAPRRVDFMHDEAIEVLPRLLDELAIERPILFGHSDGASIALIHAGSGVRPVAGLILLAPHVMVEGVTIRNIEAARHAYLNGDLAARLGKYHANVDSAFYGWNDIWLDPAFRAWNIEEFLPRIRCPILAIQGEDDEYGTMEQVERIRRGAPVIEVQKLSNCAHSPHRDKPQEVLALATAFIARLRAGKRSRRRRRQHSRAIR